MHDARAQISRGERTREENRRACEETAQLTTGHQQEVERRLEDRFCDVTFWRDEVSTRYANPGQRCGRSRHPPRPPHESAALVRAAAGGGAALHRLQEGPTGRGGSRGRGLDGPAAGGPGAPSVPRRSAEITGGHAETDPACAVVPIPPGEERTGQGRRSQGRGGNEAPHSHRPPNGHHPRTDY
ncbi:uncharacterized protein LOC125044006 [Penaeus chinensis]|uniref:uncharacterized protein LOC125044006 n=1 Tax=Penaeus chinensis TaxID=139456 RepID=UPI001FB592D1|nr:uncharacterized protein LOC125044006 [Penaeus chinensis]